MTFEVGVGRIEEQKSWSIPLTFLSNNKIPVEEQGHIPSVCYVLAHPFVSLTLSTFLLSLGGRNSPVVTISWSYTWPSGSERVNELFVLPGAGSYLRERNGEIAEMQRRELQLQLLNFVFSFFYLLLHCFSLIFILSHCMYSSLILFSSVLSQVC